MVHSDRLPWDEQPPLDSSLFGWNGDVGGRLGKLLKAPVDDLQTTPNFSAEMHRLPEQRRQLIFRIRRQIAEGSYDSDKKLELAFDRMLDAIVDDSRPDR